MTLDKTNSDIGYCLGRLFAVLEKIQKDTLNITSIRERFYTTASTRPIAAFPHLMRLRNHHLAKLLHSSKTFIYYENLLAEIIGHLPAGYPAQLSIFEQGAFSVGYYHQQQALYTKSESTQLQTEGALR